MTQYLDAWNRRRASLSALMGEPDRNVLTSRVPIYQGGGADVLVFRKCLEGIIYVTGGLTGVDGVEQVPSRAGNYELMICTRKDDARAPQLISQLARYTLT